MPHTQRRLRRVAAIFASAALVIWSNSATAASQGKHKVAGSPTARVITLSVAQSVVRIAYDPATETPEATVRFESELGAARDMLYLQSDIYPLVAQISGCRVRHDVDPKALLPDAGQTVVPLAC